METEIVLYILILNQDTRNYEILSEHPDRFEECSAIVNNSIDIETQIHSLYCNYLDLHQDYIKFIHLCPYIDKENQKLKLPFYCLIPYHNYNIKNSYRLPCNVYARYIPILRKIINMV